MSEAMCPWVQRFNYCIEPAVCDLRHKSALNTGAQVFKPTTTPAEQNDEQKKIEEEIRKQMEANQINTPAFEVLEGDGAGEAMLYIEKLAGCSCCKGYINNCSGDSCDQLGVCFCFAALSHQE